MFGIDVSNLVAYKGEGDAAFGLVGPIQCAIRRTRATGRAMRPVSNIAQHMMHSVISGHSDARRVNEKGISIHVVAAILAHLDGNRARSRPGACDLPSFRRGVVAGDYHTRAIDLDLAAASIGGHGVDAGDTISWTCCEGDTVIVGVSPAQCTFRCAGIASGVMRPVACVEQCAVEIIVCDGRQNIATVRAAVAGIPLPVVRTHDWCHAVITVTMGLLNESPRVACFCLNVVVLVGIGSAVRPVLPAPVVVLR